ncbi:MAG: DivIVA domain-containing protein [Ruminococcaceae bacterium]|nr:DivIVA domain-containing protein [Oscillospiraceae bacterium]
MFTAEEIKNVGFSKSMSGYKPEEVEIFLDKVASDYQNFEKIVNEYKAEVARLQNEIDTAEHSKNSIQSVLLNAQKLAEQIVAEAKAQSDEMIRNAEDSIAVLAAQEKEMTTTFELKAAERKANLEAELSEMVKDAKLKADSITAAADDSVRRQQVLFDKLKLEVAAFKSAVTSKYKEHLSILQEIPDAVQMDPERMAQVITARLNEVPSVDSFISPVEAKSPAIEDNGFSVVTEE